MRMDKRLWLTCLLGLASLVVAQPQEGPVWLDRAVRSEVAVAAEPYIIPAEYLPELEALPALPEGWVLPWYWDATLTEPEENREALIQYARIFGSVGVRYWHTEAELLRAKSIADEAGVGLTVTIMPYHINGCQPDPRDWSMRLLELLDIQEFLQRIKREPLSLNVVAFSLDSECFNEADPRVTTLLSMVFDLVKSEFPDTLVLWFADAHRVEMWDARHDARTVACYASYAASQTEEWFKRWYDKDPDADWGMWISLDSGYWRGSWELVLNRDPIEYWMFGRMLRTLREFGIVQHVIIYPFLRPNAPTWHQSFCAFVRGATGMGLEE